MPERTGAEVECANGSVPRVSTVRWNWRLRGGRRLFGLRPFARTLHALCSQLFCRDAFDDQAPALKLCLHLGVAREKLPPEVRFAKGRIKAQADATILRRLHPAGEPLELQVELLLSIVGQPVRFRE